MYNTKSTFSDWLHVRQLTELYFSLSQQHKSAPTALFQPKLPKQAHKHVAKETLWN